MRETVKIGERILEHDGEPFIVAEAGINHNGEVALAFEMIEAAKSANVDAIKFQTFKAREFVVDEKQTYTYKSQGQEITESMLTMFERYEFTADEWRRIKIKCDESDIMIGTPFLGQLEC